MKIFFELILHEIMILFDLEYYYSIFNMENHADLYLKGTQNYLIDSLSQQIHLLTPIRNSYSNLQHYQVKVSHDL